MNSPIEVVTVNGNVFLCRTVAFQGETVLLSTYDLERQVDRVFTKQKKEILSISYTKK